MTSDATTLDLNAQWISPPRLQWILDVGHWTVSDWNKKKLITHFRDERIIRYQPADVREFILGKMLFARSARSAVLNPVSPIVRLDEETLERLARLTAVQAKALVDWERREAA